MWDAVGGGRDVRRGGGWGQRMGEAVPQAGGEGRGGGSVAVAEGVWDERVGRVEGATREGRVDSGPGLGKRGGVGRS